MPIGIGSLATEVLDRIFAAAGQKEMVGLRPGAKALQTLYLAANVVAGDTITIGDDVLTITVLNTTTGRTCAGLANVSDPVLMTLSGAPATAIAVGDLVSVESEILKCLRIIDVATFKYVMARGRSGTTPASHADATTVKQAAGAQTGVPVGVITTLTPAVAGPAIVDEFNNVGAGTQFEQAASKVPVENANFTAVPTLGLAVGQQVVFIANAAGVDVTATTSAFDNYTDNLWGAATVDGGAEPGVLKQDVQSRVVSTSAELVGQIHFAFPFTVRAAVVQVRDTNGVAKAFTGSVKIAYSESTDAAMPAGTVTVRNVGAASTAYAVPFVATDVITVIAFE